MKMLLALSLLSLGLMTAPVHAADPTASFEAKSAEKKLAGAAKNSFVKKCVEDAKPAAPAAGADACEKAAAEKKLAGAAKNSFVKKCTEDAKAGAAKK